MADYRFPTVIQQTIPNADMTPLERLVLTHIFDSEPDGDGLYFFAEDGARDSVYLPAAELKAALAEADGVANALFDHVRATMPDLAPTEPDAEIDLSATSWLFILQDIVRRSATLKYVSAVTSYTCTKMRPDGFGGSVTFITADDIQHKSTDDILEEYVGAMERSAPLPSDRRPRR